ncbi:MAG: hypothetical protein PVJ78_07320 [Gammaproteobacteria bacterium]|jgi:hypothetical protein
MFVEVFVIGFFAGYVLLVGLALHVLTKNVTRLWIKIPIVTVLAVVFLFVFFADILVGRWRLNHACETEGGLHIYHKVALGPEYWREDGSPKSINISGNHVERGNFNSEIFDNRIIKVREDYVYEKYPRIRVGTTKIIDQANNQILGEVKILFYKGGRFLFLLGDYAGARCPKVRGLYTKLYTDIFFKKDEQTGG